MWYTQLTYLVTIVNWSSIILFLVPQNYLFGLKNKLIMVYKFTKNGTTKLLVWYSK